MRKRTLSDDGVRLFLNGMSVKSKPRNLRQIVWNLFHSDYDESLERVVEESKDSSKSLLNFFEFDSFDEILESSVSHTIKLILTRDQKKMTRKQLHKNMKFFVDCMKMSFEQGDYQTAHLILFAVTHPIFLSLKPKKQRWADAKIKEIQLFLGGPTYNQHIEYWKGASCVELPSLFAFRHFISRSLWQNKMSEAEQASKMIEVTKYINYSSKKASDIYNQPKISKFELQQLSEKLIKK